MSVESCFDIKSASCVYANVSSDSFYINARYKYYGSKFPSIVVT